MAGGFFHKLLGGAPALPPEVEAALADLVCLATERPALASPVALLRDILPALVQDTVLEPPPLLTREQAAAKIASGVPLLRGKSISIDERLFGRRWQAICAALQRQQAGDAARLLAEALRHARLMPAELVQEVLAGKPEGIHARCDVLGLDASLAATVLRLTLYPVLTRVSAALAPLREGLRWNPGYCPTCGSWPLLGEFRGLEQTRVLRCGLCAAEWEFPRLRCLFCGTRDHEMLGYLHVEGEEAKHRAATCDACRGYVKVVTTLTALSAPALLVADVATLHLDLAAAERGYTT